jgi:hypothetical protein
MRRLIPSTLLVLLVGANFHFAALGPGRGSLETATLVITAWHDVQYLALLVALGRVRYFTPGVDGSVAWGRGVGSRSREPEDATTLVSPGNPIHPRDGARSVAPPWIFRGTPWLRFASVLFAATVVFALCAGAFSFVPGLAGSEFSFEGEAHPYKVVTNVLVGLLMAHYFIDGRFWRASADPRLPRDLASLGAVKGR